LGEADENEKSSSKKEDGERMNSGGEQWNDSRIWEETKAKRLEKERS